MAHDVERAPFLLGAKRNRQELKGSEGVLLRLDRAVQLCALIPVRLETIDGCGRTKRVNILDHAASSTDVKTTKRRQMLEN